MPKGIVATVDRVATEASVDDVAAVVAGDGVPAGVAVDQVVVAAAVDGVGLVATLNGVPSGAAEDRVVSGAAEEPRRDLRADRRPEALRTLVAGAAVSVSSPPAKGAPSPPPCVAPTELL